MLKAVFAAVIRLEGVCLAPLAPRWKGPRGLFAGAAIFFFRGLRGLWGVVVVRRPRSWRNFIPFNRSRRNAEVPAGYLQGFVRKWRTSGRSVPTEVGQQREPFSSENRAFLALTSAASLANRHFHAADLIRKIGAESEVVRVAAVIKQFCYRRFAVALAFHGQAVWTCLGLVPLL